MNFIQSLGKLKLNNKLVMYKDGGWNNRLKLVSCEGELLVDSDGKVKELANISHKLVYAENVNKEYFPTLQDIPDEKDEWYVLKAPEVVNGVDLGNMIGKKILSISYDSDDGFFISLCNGKKYNIDIAEFGNIFFPPLTITEVISNEE